MINAGAHRFAAPAAVVQLRRQVVGIGDSHRRHTARSRPGAVGVAASPSGAEARGSLKRAVAIVGATGLPYRPSGSHSRRRAVGEQLRYRAAASAACSCPLAVARFALMPVNLLSCRNFQGGSIPARCSGSLLDRRTRDADVVDHQRAGRGYPAITRSTLLAMPSDIKVVTGLSTAGLLAPAVWIFPRASGQPSGRPEGLSGCVTITSCNSEPNAPSGEPIVWRMMKSGTGCFFPIEQAGSFSSTDL